MPLAAKQMFGFEKTYKLLMNVEPIFASKKTEEMLEMLKESFFHTSMTKGGHSE